MTYEELINMRIDLGNAKDLSGKQYGKLLVLFRVQKPRNTRKAFWGCKCECGNYCIIESSHLQDGHTQSCGCLHSPDLIGKTFTFLTVIERTDNNRKYKHDVIWKCKCRCGNYTTVSTTDLINGRIKSCGCYGRAAREEEIRGKRFGKLIAIEPMYNLSKYGEIAWKCKCDCGNIKIIPRRNFASGLTRSCGCIASTNSLGAQQIESSLKQLEIKFEREKIFSNCVFPDSKKHPRFDFYLPDYNTCIEYDGKQHFEPIAFFGGQESFERTKCRDNYKTEWCLQNHIKLIRIPYTDTDKIDSSYILHQLN